MRTSARTSARLAARLALPALALLACGSEVPAFTDPGALRADLSRAADRARGFERFGDAGAAAAAIISRTDPLVVGFGEYHATTDGAKAVPGLTRFGDQILPVIAAGSGGLIIETYVQDQGCGREATAAAAHVETTIKRPVETENHIMRVLRLSKAAGVQGYILEKMSCEDLADLRATGEVDYSKLLGLVARRLGDRIEQLLDKTGGEKRVLVYGGSLHNEVVPSPTLAEYSYVKRIAKRTGERYVEIDFLIPEFIRGDKFLPEQAWFATAMAEANEDSVLVFERTPKSFVIIAKRGVMAPE